MDNSSNLRQTSSHEDANISEMSKNRKPTNIYDYEGLRRQTSFQKKGQWDLELDIKWEIGIDQFRGLLPMDNEYIGFPGASDEQKLALSQFMGLTINATISEMEDVAFGIRKVAWKDILDSYPVNPEMYQLGEEFFKEELKHSQAFRRYNRMFSEKVNVTDSELAELMPSAYGSIFRKAILKNAQDGGHAFWWVVAAVEEIALLIYQGMRPHRAAIDPLFYHVHKKHFEEESKHTNYAFLMLDLIKERNRSIKHIVHQKTDLVYSELFSTSWVLTEIQKIFRVQKYAHRHEFFQVLKSCLPLLEKMTKPQLIQRMFVSAPYLSFVLNPKRHKLSTKYAKDHGAMRFWVPEPLDVPTNVASIIKDSDSDAIWKISS